MENYAAWNQELNGNLKFIVIPSIQSLGHISSSSIRELYELKQEATILNHMNPMVYYRWIRYHKTGRFKMTFKECPIPSRNIYFGRSCFGKSTMLKRPGKGLICDVDKEIWNFIKPDNDSVEDFRHQLQEGFKKCLYTRNQYEFRKLIDILAQNVDWEEMFNNWDSYDFPVLGNYWRWIPEHILANFNIVQIYATKRNYFLKQRAKERNMSYNDLLQRTNFLDSVYQDAPFWDKQHIVT